jgi:hypothetical protein
MLWCSPVLYILALALADDAFKEYSTLEEILELEPPLDQNIWHLEWKDGVLDLPVFRKMSLHGPTNTIQSSSSYDRQLSDLGHRAGFEVNISVHDARREALVKADGKLSLQLSPSYYFGSSYCEKITATPFPRE